MDNILISVVVPVYNLEKYISKCINSIRNQTLKNFELIIIDDGSSDSSYEVIKKYVIEDNRIKYIKQENKGVSSARNKGIEIAKGKYITFVDGDDSIHPRMLEDMYSLASKKRFELLFCLFSNSMNSTLNNSINKLKILSADNYIANILEGKVQRSACGVLFNLDLVKKNFLFFDETLSYGEDMFFTINALLLTNSKVGLLSENYYYVGQREGSAIRTINPDQYDKIELLAFKLDTLFEKQNIKYKYKLLLDKYYFFDVIFSIAHLINSNISILKKISKLKEIKKSSHANNSLHIKFQTSILVKTKANIIRLTHPIIVLLVYKIISKIKR